VDEAVIWIGASMCRLLQPLGALDGAAQMCGEPGPMMAFGSMTILMGGIAAAMLSVMGRNIRPRQS
jgi:hypothetical protein